MGIRVREQFVAGKSADRVCEDLIVVTDDFAAVIDGASDATGADFAGKTGGRLAAEIVATDARCFQLPLDDHLGRDACMIGARLPQGVVALHPVVAGEGVHDSVLECMTHMQTAGDIRWRKHDAVGSITPRRLEVGIIFPVTVPALFNGVRAVAFVHVLCHFPIV